MLVKSKVQTQRLHAQESSRAQPSSLLDRIDHPTARCSIAVHVPDQTTVHPSILVLLSRDPTKASTTSVTA